MINKWACRPPEQRQDRPRTRSYCPGPIAPGSLLSRRLAERLQVRAQIVGVGAGEKSVDHHVGSPPDRYRNDKQRPARRCQFRPASRAIEQVDAEDGFQLAHLSADSAVSDAELFGSDC